MAEPETWTSVYTLSDWTGVGSLADFTEYWENDKDGSGSGVADTSASDELRIRDYKQTGEIASYCTRLDTQTTTETARRVEADVRCSAVLANDGFCRVWAPHGTQSTLPGPIQESRGYWADVSNAGLRVGYTDGLGDTVLNTSVLNAWTGSLQTLSLTAWKDGGNVRLTTRLDDVVVHDGFLDSNGWTRFDWTQYIYHAATICADNSSPTYNYRNSLMQSFTAYHVVFAALELRAVAGECKPAGGAVLAECKPGGTSPAAELTAAGALLAEVRGPGAIIAETKPPGAVAGEVR